MFSVNIAIIAQLHGIHCTLWYREGFHIDRHYELSHCLRILDLKCVCMYRRANGVQKTFQKPFDHFNSLIHNFKFQHLLCRNIANCVKRPPSCTVHVLSMVH